MTINRYSMTGRKFQTTPPAKNIPLLAVSRVIAQASSASAAYETAIFAASQRMKLNQISLVPDTTITGAVAGAVGLLNLWRGGAQVGTDGLLGLFNFAAVSTPTALAALTPGIVVPNRPIVWTGTIGAVTGASSTGATATAIGQSTRSNGFITATSQVVVAPGLALEETITLSAFNTSTGVFSIAASGTFANSHPAGTVVVVLGDYLFQGTTAAITGGTTTNAAITATGASALTQITTASAVTYDPGLATQETIPAGQFTYVSGTGVLTIAATYNGGKFAQSHASGGQVVLLPGTGNGGLLPDLSQDDVVTFKWLQLGTGLALPASTLYIDYGI